MNLKLAILFAVASSPVALSAPAPGKTGQDAVTLDKGSGVEAVASIDFARTRVSRRFSYLAILDETARRGPFGTNYATQLQDADWSNAVASAKPQKDSLFGGANWPPIWALFEPQH
ncbi:hypothetical protein PWT90_07000 [Aphanocladium album]|nr:hypothetical protein PWT90_07000 [Aphanocladium album]